MSLREVGHVALKYLQALDSPRALTVAILIRYEEWEQIARLRISPSNYCEKDSFKFECDYLATELLRKFPGFELPLDLESEARTKFWQSEHQNCRTNARLLPYITDPLHEDCDPHVLEFLKRVRRRVARILGRIPDEIHTAFGPGATFESRELGLKGELCLGDKLEQVPHRTRDCALFDPLVEQSAWGRMTRSEFNYRTAPVEVRGNRFFTVPKSAIDLRGACAEPGQNVFLQKGIGLVIRNRLRRVGIDIVNGQKTHGALMARGSREGSLATIDLSSASDTICRELVRLLLPEDWYSLLNSLRSQFTLIDRKWVYLEKFSSMGNGFTFELETLLFYAISQEVCGDAEFVSVYGDDIIVPTDYGQAVISALRFLGLSPNPRKSFVDGLFKESCGTDAFNGRVIAPFRWDSTPETPADWISVHNGIRKATGDMCWEALRACFAYVPSEVRACKGPSELGDVVFHTDEVQDWNIRVGQPYSRQFNPDVRYFRVYRPVGRSVGHEHFPRHVQFALALYGVASDGVPLRGVGGHRLDWQPYS